jgi:hypothetical protein
MIYDTENNEGIINAVCCLERYWNIEIILNL